MQVDSEGRKFGKSTGGAIWLSAEKLSPYKFYQYLFQVRLSQSGWAAACAARVDTRSDLCMPHGLGTAITRALSAPFITPAACLNVFPLPACR